MNKPARRAFSLIELLTVISVIAIMASLLLVSLSSAKAKSRQTVCVNNLHQLGLGFTGYVLDHEQKYPMDVPERLGGSAEYNQSRIITNTPLSRDYRHFIVLSNEVPNVKVMTCPADRRRRPARDYQTFTNANLSYWVNTKAIPHATLALLVGDWNVLAPLSTSNNLTQIGFGREVHNHKGSVLFADGRVEITRTIVLQTTAPPEDSTSIAATGTSSRRAGVSGDSQGRSQNPPHPDSPRTAANSPTIPQNPTPPVATANAPDLKRPTAFEPPATNKTSDATIAKLPDTSPSSSYSISPRNDSPSAGRAEPPAAPPVQVIGGVDNRKPVPEDPEPWNTPGFRIFKALAFVSYLISLLLALVALLILYLRARLTQRAQEKAPGIKTD